MQSVRGDGLTAHFWLLPLGYDGWLLGSQLHGHDLPHLLIATGDGPLFDHALFCFIQPSDQPNLRL